MSDDTQATPASTGEDMTVEAAIKVLQDQVQKAHGKGWDEGFRAGYEECKADGDEVADNADDALQAYKDAAEPS